MISIGTASAAPLPENTDKSSSAETVASGSSGGGDVATAATRDADADPAKSPTVTPVQEAARDIIGVKDNTPMPHEPVEPVVAAAEQSKKKVVVTPRPVPEISHAELCNTLAAAAERHDVPVALFANLIWQESRFRPQAVSPVGALGVAQFMPRVAEEVGLKNPFNPLEAIPAAARFFSGLVDRFGSLGLATAAYNAGSGRVGAWIAKRGGLPKETQHYVQTITGRPAEHWRSASGKNAVFAMAKTLPCRQLATFAKYDQADLPEQRQVAEQRGAKVLQASLKSGGGVAKSRGLVVNVKAALAARDRSKVVAKATVRNAKAADAKLAKTDVSSKAKTDTKKVRSAGRGASKAPPSRARVANHRGARMKMAGGR